MQIITKVFTNFNTPDKIIIYGPNEIPEGHELYGHKLTRHGTYTRNLILNGITLVVIIFRFCEKTETGYVTYSLLPFYITPFQRHSNMQIDRVLQLFFFEHRSMFSISKELNIGISTIRQWIYKFTTEIEHFVNGTEEMMIASKPGYRAASSPLNNVFEKVHLIFKKVFYLAKYKSLLLDFGVISWLNLNFNI